MTCLSCWVLGSTWLSPPKRFFGVFPKQFCPHGRWTLIPLVSQFPAVFWANGCCFRKGSVQGFRRPFFTFVSHRWCFIQVLWRVPPTVLYIYLPVSSWGQSCWHVSPMQIQSAETTHHVVAVGVFFGLISLNLVGDISKKIRDYPHLEIFFTSEIIFQFFWGNIGVYVQEALWKV